MPYITIKAATQNDALAIQNILKHYERYMNKLATKVLTDECGNAQYIIDKDTKEQLTTALLQMTLDFKIRYR